MRPDSVSEEKYRLSVEKERFVLVAKSYRAEKGSVLHSGIFSRELASSFVGASVALFYLMIVYLRKDVSIIQFVIAALVFALVTLFSRIYLFKEPFLETRIEKDDITITLNRPIFKKVLRRSIKELRDIKMEHRRFEPENPDAVEFVEKIALQHGTVIPGFGKPQDFYTLVLDFGDESLGILTTEHREDIEGVLVKLKDLLRQQGIDYTTNN